MQSARANLRVLSETGRRARVAVEQSTNASTEDSVAPTSVSGDGSSVTAGEGNFTDDPVEAVTRAFAQQQLGEELTSAQDLEVVVVEEEEEVTPPCGAAMGPAERRARLKQLLGEVVDLLFPDD